ncbi:MAG: radical SAM protein [Candidatus Alcyoniella australis]|nr:radical SAM protein [Candidatus Alcyoniella australis]
MRPRQLVKAAAGFASAKLWGRRIPLAVGWDVTHRCNLRCLYCGFERLDPGELDTARALELIDAMADAGCVRLHLSGGEPMLRDDIGELIGRVLQRGMACALNTNGFRIDSRIDQVRHVDAIRLSYDGPREVHDQLRGQGAHAQMLAALEAARDAGTRVVLNATLNARNVGMLDELLAFAAAQRTPIKFQPVVPGLAYGKGLDGLEPEQPQLEAAVRRLLLLKARNRLIVNSRANLDYYLQRPDPGALPCVAGKLYTRVDPLGRLYPCSMMRREPLMRDALQLGFRRAFEDLPAVRCSDCICPPTLELNMLYDLNLRSLLNLRKYL